MPSIWSRIGNVSQAINLIRTINESASENGYERRVYEAYNEAASAQIIPLLKSEKVRENPNLSDIYLPKESIDKAAAQANKLIQAAMAGNPQKINSLLKEFNSIFKDAKDKWAKMINSGRYQPIQDTLREACLYDTTAKGNLGIFNQKMQTFADLAQAYSSADDFSQAIVYAEKYRQVHSTTPGVSAFIGKLNSGTASLDDLTDEVMKWISEKNLKGRILLRFSMK